MTFEEGRALFPVLERVAYLNAGSCGPLARSTADAVESQLRADVESGRAGKAYFEGLLALREELRALLAALVGVEASQVALTSSTTDACNIVLAGLELGPEDEIVTTAEEHFGLLGPLHASGARVVVTPAEPEAILGAVTPRTRLIAISHVLWTSGRILPVHELRRQSGVRILVDAAQSVGAIPVDARALDFLTVSGQKWLCGPHSTGALIVAEPERLRIAQPGYFSQTSYEPSGHFEPRDGAARFDRTWLAFSSLAGLVAAVEQAPEWWFARAAEQARRCRELLAPHVELVPGNATLVSFRVDDSEALVVRLAEQGVVVRDIPGTGIVRASCGWWTSDEDLDRLVAGVTT